MLTHQSIKCIRWLLRGGHILRVSVLDWDDSAGQVVVTKSKWTWLLATTLFSYMSVQSIFELSQLIRLAGDPSEPYVDYMKLLMQWLSRLLSLVILINSLFRGGSKARLMNQMLGLNNRFKEVKGAEGLKDAVKFLSRAALFLAFVNPVFAVTAFLEDRAQSRYWHHLVIPSTVFPFTLPFFGFVEYLIAASGFQNCLFYLFLTTTYFRTSREWMKLIMNVDDLFGSRWSEDSLSLFRTMQVYNQIYNNTMAALWSFQVASAFMLEVLAIVLSLKLGPTAPFPTNLMFPTACIALFYITLTVYKVTTATTDLSEDMSRRFKISGDKYRRTVGASMKILRVEVRPFFYMEKTTSLAFTNEVVDKTISILVAAG